MTNHISPVLGTVIGPEESVQPLLSVSQLNVSYGQSQVLFDVDLDVMPSQIACLMGRNGVGKTTLIKAMMGLLRSTSGSVTYKGEDITGWPPHKRARAGISYVPQGRGIFPQLSVHDNLIMGLEATENRRDFMGEVEEMYETFPALKIDPAKLGGTLSGGQQQQLALARALVRKPTLLLLDEPTEGIQPSIVQEIGELLETIRSQQDTAILLVEQFLDFAFDVSDYCYVMEKGSIVLDDLVSDLDQAQVSQYIAV